jgi:hypothetical protein
MKVDDLLHQGYMFTPKRLNSLVYIWLIFYTLYRGQASATVQILCGADASDYVVIPLAERKDCFSH